VTDKSGGKLNIDMLKGFFQEGDELLAEIVAAEELLQEVVIRGDHEAITASQNYRDALQDRVGTFKEMLLSLDINKSDIAALVKEIDEEEESEQFLDLYEAVAGKIKHVNVLQSINGDLLRERFSFIKNMQKYFLPGEELYDQRGELKDILDKEIRNIDKSC